MAELVQAGVIKAAVIKAGVDQQAVLAGITELLPVFRQRAQEAEDGRVVPAESVKVLAETGFFRLLQPASFGGLEADPVTFFTAVRLIASACGSTGWVASVVGVHPWQLALFPPQAQDDVWGADPATRMSSSYAPTGKATRVKGDGPGGTGGGSPPCAEKAGGGDTGLVDGFAAAVALRATDAESFDTLARTPVPFGYIDKETELRASLPLIQLSPLGRVRGVRFNNRSARPLRLPYAEVTAFYAAYRRWAELLARPERQLNLRLAPGDCLVFDNTRVLHARTAFGMTAGSPGRHLQGCYADLDGLASTLAVLRRQEKQ